jgi:hypothetical protein
LRIGDVAKFEKRQPTTNAFLKIQKFIVISMLNLMLEKYLQMPQ